MFELVCRSYYGCCCWGNYSI